MEPTTLVPAPPGPAPPARSEGSSPLNIHPRNNQSPSTSPVRNQQQTTSRRPPRPNLRRQSGSVPGRTTTIVSSHISTPSVTSPATTSQLSTPPTGIISPPLSPRPESATIHHVLETHTISRHHNQQTGNPTINNYELLGDIGAGVHGKVKKAKDSETGTVVAIKIISRTTKKRLGNYDPNEQENKIKREIAIMKKCHHPNIVNLIEVIDNPNSQKVYLGNYPSPPINPFPPPPPAQGIRAKSSFGVCRTRRNNLAR